MPPAEVIGRPTDPPYAPAFRWLRALRITGNPERQNSLYRGLLEGSPRLKHVEIISNRFLSERFSYCNTMRGLVLPLQTLVLHEVALAAHGSTIADAVDFSNLRTLQIWSCVDITSFLRAIVIRCTHLRRLRNFLCHTTDILEAEPLERIFHACDALESISVAARSFDRTIDHSKLASFTALEDLAVACWNPPSGLSSTVETTSGVSDHFWKSLGSNFTNLRTVTLVLPDTCWQIRDARNSRLVKVLSMLRNVPQLIAMHCDRGVPPLDQHQRSGPRRYPVIEVCEEFEAGDNSWVEPVTEDLYYIVARGCGSGVRCVLPLPNTASDVYCMKWPNGVSRQTMTEAQLRLTPNLGTGST